MTHRIVIAVSGRVRASDARPPRSLRGRSCVAFGLAAAFGVACSGTSVPDTSARTTKLNPSTTTAVQRPLTERIARRWEGVQLGTSTAGRAVFFHHGNWAAEAYERPDGWCLRATYRWSIAEARSESDFVVRYDVLDEPSGCFPSGAARFVLSVTDVRDQDGHRSYSGAYTEPLRLPVTRTSCTAHWDEPEPCGFSLPAFRLPTPP